MSGTIQGGIKARDTNIERHGPDFYKKIGTKGGSVSTPTGGFAADRKRASEAGRKGGLKSRRGKKNDDK